MLDLSQPLSEGLEDRDASSSTSKARCDPKHELVEEQSLHVNLPSVAPDKAMWHLFPTKRNLQGVHSLTEGLPM